MFVGSQQGEGRLPAASVKQSKCVERSKRVESSRPATIQTLLNTKTTNRPAEIRNLLASGTVQLGENKLAAKKQSVTVKSTKADDEAGGEHNKAAEDEKYQPTGKRAASGQKNKIGLLEALLGGGPKSWFEQKNVILNIENKTKSDEKIGASEQHKHNSSLPQNIREINSSKLKYSRLPTFGSVPQKLNSVSSSWQPAEDSWRLEATSQPSPNRLLPQFNHKERLTLNNAASITQPQRIADTQPGSLASGQLSSSNSLLVSSRSPSSSVTTSASSSSEEGRNLAPAREQRITHNNKQTSSGATNATLRQQTPTSLNKPQIRQPNQANATSRKASSRGFSNLSNLFPQEPMRLWPRQQLRKTTRSASLLNLHHADDNSLLKPGGKKFLFSSSSSPTQRHKAPSPSQKPLVYAKPIVTQTIRSGQRTTMRRTTTSSSQQQLAGSGSSLNQQQAAAFGSGKREINRRRPLSASGHYGSGARARSPSASYRLGSAGMSPLVDPDCPMHGTDQPQLDRGGRTRYPPFNDYELNQAPARDYEARHHPPTGYYTTGPLDVYDDNMGVLDDPYNSRVNLAGRANYRASSPIYSPISPIDHAYDPWNERHPSAQTRYSGRASNTGAPLRPSTGAPHAYYNGQSRFSLYHQAGDGRIGSSLAPTSEQLRRILGYKPAGPHSKPVHLHPQWAYTRPFIHLQPAGSGFGRSPSPLADDSDEPLDGTFRPEVPKFAPLNRLQDNQAIRAVDFHPSGEVYAIGSNSRALRICAYPAEHELRNFDPFENLDNSTGGGGGVSGGDLAQGQQQTSTTKTPAGYQPKPPRVLFKFLQVHRGSIYCVSFNSSGQLLATGSNDQTVHIVKYNSVTHNPDGEEFRLTMHNGTVRDLCFIDDSSGNGSSLLLSAGGGDNKIYVTDCDTITPFQSMAGHTQMVMALNHCGGAQFVSGSYDRTIRFWDLRTRSCTSIVSAPPLSTGLSTSGATAGPGAPVCTLRVDPSGRLLVSGHTDTTCMLYDIRGGKIIQTFRPHDDEVRAISFSPKSYYLLTGGYDGRLVVSDLQGDLTQPLPSACVAESQDKIVQAKWHPADFTFVSTSADKSATLWSLPGEIRS